MYDNCIFLLIPNNSGSTFSYRSIAKCEKIASLRGEGQFVDGFIGTKPVDYNTQFIWAGTDFRHILPDETKHDWDNNKKVWAEKMVNWEENNTFVEKSPPNIGKLDMLQKNFPNCRFVVSVRNPYALFESIKRVRSRRPVSDDIIVRHIINTMKIQRNNIENLKKQDVDFVFYRYEDLCENTEMVVNKLKNVFPEFHDISFNHVIPVKRRYNSAVKNYNSEQINRLSTDEISFISKNLSNYPDLMDYFDYQII